MILLDTHISVWWVHGDRRLSPHALSVLESHEGTGLGVSMISCWEVSKLVEVGRLSLPIPIEEWVPLALDYPGVEPIDLTPEIAVQSTRLPGSFHKDPADQILVATSRVLELPLATMDEKILAYEEVETLIL